MGIQRIMRWALALLIAIFLPLSSTAQDETQAPGSLIRIDYGKRYQLEDSYSILYDNAAAPAKLKAFQILFYDPEGRVLLETETEIHPAGAYIETYRLNAPVSGFSQVGLSVLSLHEGTLADFPDEIGAILGLSEMTELPEVDTALTQEEPTEEERIQEEPTPAPEIPTLSAAEKAELTEANAAIDTLLSRLDETLEVFESEAAARETSFEQLDGLIENTATLAQEAQTPERATVKSEIEALSTELNRAKNTASVQDVLADLRTAKTEGLALKSQLQNLLTLSEAQNTDISSVMSTLEGLKNQMAELDSAVTGAALPDALTATQFAVWNSRYDALAAQLNPTPASSPLWILLLGMGLAILAGLATLAKGLFGGKAKTRPFKAALNQGRDIGVVFPASPLLAGNVAAPLSATGQLTASQLQMMNGPYAHLRDAYQATGRIGYAQDGVPTAKDYSFGTGFLITDRHVMTNRHVHGMYGHYLLDDEDPGGIEFIAEKDKDASDFVPFANEPPLLLPALDIAIYRLARPVKNRKPLALTPIETEELEAREIIVIGYPDTHTPDDEDIKAVVEENAIFAVKRISQGRIFRHSTDTDIPFGVETRVSEDKETNFKMPAICHNASTLGGNSGSPLLDLKTGELVGVHFAGFKAFNKKEAANLAMAIAQLAEDSAQNQLTTVTEITV